MTSRWSTLLRIIWHFSVVLTQIYLLHFLFKALDLIFDFADILLLLRFHDVIEELSMVLLALADVVDGQPLDTFCVL